MSNNVWGKTIEFIKMEKGHKERCFNTKKEFKIKKLDLLKKHCNEKSDLCIKELEDMQKNGCTPELAKKYLEEKIALHEKHIQECEKLCNEKEEAKKIIREKNKQERENFKKTL